MSRFYLFIYVKIVNESEECDGHFLTYFRRVVLCLSLEVIQVNSQDVNRIIPLFCSSFFQMNCNGIGQCSVASFGVFMSVSKCLSVVSHVCRHTFQTVDSGVVSKDDNTALRFCITFQVRIVCDFSWLISNKSDVIFLNTIQSFYLGKLLYLIDNFTPKSYNVLAPFLC